MPGPIGIPVVGLIGGAPGIPMPGTPPGIGLIGGATGMPEPGIPPGTELVGTPPGTLGIGLTGMVPVPPGIPPGIIVGGAFVPVPGTVFVVTLGTAGAGTPAIARLMFELRRQRSKTPTADVRFMKRMPISLNSPPSI